MAFPLVAVLASAGSIFDTVGKIFTSNDNVQIAQTEVAKAKEAVNSVKALGDIEQTKLAEKALELRIAELNKTASVEQSDSTVRKTRIIGIVILVSVLSIIGFFIYKIWVNRRYNTPPPNQYFNQVNRNPQSVIPPNNNNNIRLMPPIRFIST
jgi:hypothetical protein